MTNAANSRRRGAKAVAPGDETGEQLVQGLVRLLEAGRPFHEVGIAEISESAGVTRSAFYFYFANKAEALAAAALAYRVDMGRAAAPFIEGGGGDDFYPSMERSLRQVLTTWGQQHAILHAMIEASVTDPTIDEAWQEWMLSFAEPVLARVEQQAALLGVEVDGALARSVVTRLLWMNERNLYRLFQAESPSADACEDFLRSWYTVWRASVSALLERPF